VENQRVQFARTLALCVLLGGASAAFAQQNTGAVDKNTVLILAGESQWLSETSDIANALSHQNGLKLLPVQGSGCVESAADIMQISSIDAAVLTADCVEYAQAQGLLPASPKTFSYVSRLDALPVFIITGRDNNTLTSLAGKRIATGPAHSATFATGELLLGGMSLPFQRVPKSGYDALSLLEDGVADAVLMVGTSQLRKKLDPQRFHILSLSAPADIADDYKSVRIPMSSLLGLSESDVETISTPLLLVSGKAPTKSAKIKNFIAAFVEMQSTSKKASELSVSIDGWTREPTATNALKALQIDPEKPTQKGEGS
jgi:TRAP-type uncharacterized transport system substrate-binding protein